MTDHNWVIPPPGAGAVTFVFEAADDVELSPAALAALEALASELGADVVRGTPDDTQGFRNCNDGTCQPYRERPCYVYSTCKVALPARPLGM